MNAGMNSIKAETSRYLTIQEKTIRHSPHTVVVILEVRRETLIDRAKGYNPGHSG